MSSSRMRARHVAGAVILFAFAALSGTARGQTVVHVQLASAAGDPVAGANVSVLRGLSEVVGQATTDSAGSARFVFTAAKGEYQIRSRKIGYTAGDRVFNIDRPADTATYRVLMQPLSARLDSVRVTARADAHDLYLDADSIAASSRPLVTAWDIVTKLRPDMLRGRSGACGGIQEVWVDGERVRDFVTPSTTNAARRNVGVPPGTRFSSHAFAVLSEIDPMHIATMVYHDCNDFSVNAARAQNALFITLKQGVDYVPGEGTFVLDDPAPRAPLDEI